MFKYSHRFLEKLAGEKIDYLDFDRNWLDLQGFEVASEEVCGDDAIVELEVKANRPDMLSHLGVLREYYVYKGYKREPDGFSQEKAAEKSRSYASQDKGNQHDGMGPQPPQMGRPFLGMTY